MAETMIELADGYWSIRGEFKVAGVLNLGTHCALVRKADGRFVLLDSYTLPDDIKARVDALTDGGTAIDAILNLHPFHTLHCEWMHEAYPQAALYGTARHRSHLPDLPWEEVGCEHDALADLFGTDFAFSVPRGMPLVCDDETVHFASVLALHRSSGIIHVDDTFVYLDKGFPFSLLPMNRRFGFHPTLAKALDPEAGAADRFREWAIELGIEWADARRIVAAHDGILELAEGEFPDRIGEALGRVGPVLEKHRARYG